ncbi:MAG: HDIG domain-containing metalloprotein [Candidatus Hodarchaeota archaeon]
MAFPKYTECLQLLVNFLVPPNVINHLIYTAQNAMKISLVLKEKNHVIDCELVLSGAMLHDIGRCRSHHIDHGILGAQLLRQQKFPEQLAKIAENHLFGGITKQEAIELGLPQKDFMPRTLEEKIITYADNISKGERILSTNEVIERYSKYLKRSHPIMLRVRTLHCEIEMLLDKK